MLTRFLRLSLLLLATLAPLSAQIFRLGDPLALSASGQGWSVAPNTGALQFAFPVASLAGDMPVPLVFRMNGSHTVSTRLITQWDEATQRLITIPITGDRPVYGTVNFGYIGGGANFEGFEEPSATVLENGLRVQEAEWREPEFVTAFTLPSRFGFTSVAGVLKDPSGTLATYDATLSHFGSHGSALQAALPTGFQAANDFTAFKVVVDQDKARIFVRLVEFNAWVPVMWVDRGGREVVFKWAFQSGLALPLSCSALVEGGQKGIKLAWKDEPSSNQEQLLLETSFVGSQAPNLPSLKVYGYPGVAGGRPVGLSQPTADYLPMLPAIPGPRGRPTRVEMRADGELRQWIFTYDANLAEVVSMTDAAGVDTDFTYASQTIYQSALDPLPLWIRGVAESSGQGSAVTLSRTWARNLPTPSAPAWNCEITEDQSGSEAGGQRRVRLTYAPLGDEHHGNGALITEEILGANNTVAAKTTYTPWLEGVNSETRRSASSSSHAIIERQGEPTRVASTTTTSDGIFPKTQTVTVAGEEVSRVANLSALDPGNLKPYRLTQSTHTLRSQGALLGTLTSGAVYGADGLPSRTFEQAGTLKAGQDFTYNQGRLSGATAFVDGTSGGAMSQAFGYTTGGAMDRVTVSGGGLSLVTQDLDFTAEGLPWRMTDAAGNVQTVTYDGWGRPTAITRSGAANVAITYYGLFNRTITQNGLSRWETYDDFGRLTQMRLPDGRTLTPTYDRGGRRVAMHETNAAGTSRSSSTSYDALDRVLSSVSATGVDTVMAYAAAGQLSRITATTRGSVTTETWLDAHGRVVSQTAPDGVVTTSIYNARGQATEVKILAHGQTQTRTFDYDGFGRLTSKSEPETGTTTFSSFTVARQPRTIQEAGGRTRTLGFDGLGRLTSMSSGADSLSYHYAGAFLDWMESGPYRTDFTYGNPGKRLSQEVQKKNGVTLFTVGYEMDGTGQLNAITYPSGRKVSYSHDVSGRVTSISQRAPGASTFAPVVSLATYDAWGSLDLIGFASGAQSQWKANTQGTHLEKWTVGFVGGPPEARNYLYDTMDNLTKAGDWDLHHDTQGRLRQADNPTLGIFTNHGHDGFGNNTLHDVYPGTHTPQPLNAFSFNPLVDNRIPPFTSNGGLTGWSTNVRGEATTVGTWVSSYQTIDLTWDALGRLARAAAPNANQTYAYGPHGLRVDVSDALNALNNRRYAYSSGGLLLGEYVPAANPARTGTKSAQVFHKNGTPSALSRGLGSFSAGDTVTVSVWFKAPAGLSGQVFLDDRRAYGPTETKASASAPGDGTWKQLTLTRVLTQADSLWIHLYGDMYTPTSGNATDASSVLYDDLQVSSVSQGTVLSDGFEAGITVVNTVPDSTTTWTTSGQTVEAAAWSSEPSAWNRDVIYLGGQAVAEIDTNGVHELHTDHLGSPLLVTKGPGTAAGTIEGRQVFGPYGEVIQASGYRPLTGYTGHAAVDPTGLIYMRGRFFSPAWHRFLNSDQGVDPNSWNQMAYVGGSPFQATDFSGFEMDNDCVNGYWVDKKTQVPITDDNGNKIKCGSATVEVSGGGSSVVAGGSGWGFSWPTSGGNFGSGWFGSGGGGGGAGNGQHPQTPKPNPCDKKGINFGVTAGLAGHAGAFGNGVAGQVSGSIGVYGDSFFASRADLAVTGNAGGAATLLPVEFVKSQYGGTFNTVNGVGGGRGVGVVFGNASHASQGDGWSNNASAGFGIFNVQYTYGENGIWQTSITFGAPTTPYFNKYPTYQKSASTDYRGCD